MKGKGKKGGGQNGEGVDFAYWLVTHYQGLDWIMLFMRHMI